jgi:hypothetical protein
MRKTFKIGEEAVGGIITISEAGKRAYKVECKDYYTKKVVQWTYLYSFTELVDYLEYVSSHYHADRMSKHFQTAVDKSE